MGENTIRQNLRNLAEQEQAGMWPDDKALHSAIMNLWKGRDYDPAPRFPTTPSATSTGHGQMVLPPSSSTTSVGGGVTVTYTPGTPTDADGEQAEHAPASTPAEEAEKVDAKECSKKRQHGVMARKGETCPECAYHKEAA